MCVYSRHHICIYPHLYRRKKRLYTSMAFTFSRFVGAPFWLASIVISLLAWIFGFCSVLFSTTDHYSIWELVFLLFPILATLWCVGSGSLTTYRLALLPLYVVGFIYCTSVVNTYIYATKPATKIVAGSMIVLSVDFFFWMVVLGADRLLKSTSAETGAELEFKAYKGSALTLARSNPGIEKSELSVITTDPKKSSQSNLLMSQVSTMGEAMEHGGDHRLDIAQDANVVCRAKALFNYSGSVSDPNELSFMKNEVLEIYDNSGRWWQAKKADGSLGIVPSNYVKVIKEEEEGLQPATET